MAAAPISRLLPPKAIEYRNGERQLVLRPFDVEDADRLQKAVQVTLRELYKYMDWRVKKWDFEDCLQWVIKTRAEYFLGSIYEWGCFDSKTGDLLGCVGIMPANPVNPDSWELGYWVTTSHTGKGLGTLMAQIATATSFVCFQLKRLQIGHMKENPASQRVIEKVGFHFEGTLRSYYPDPPMDRIQQGAITSKTELLYSLLPEELPGLEWYPSIVKCTRVIPLFGPACSLAKDGPGWT
jgi:RimJ/RimL family protein N-acetyltransferase